MNPLGFVENGSIPTTDGANISENSGLNPFSVDYILDNEYIRVIFILLYTVVFCFCIFGNLGVILVVTLHWKMRSKTKFCLGNLAFANFCVGVFCVYQNLSTFLIDKWLFGNVMCKMYNFVNSFSHTASILILVVICVERYLAILHPLSNRKWITMKRLRVVIVGVWVLSGILCSPRLYYITSYHIPVPSLLDEEASYDMICAPLQTLYPAHIVDTVYFVLLFLLPLIVMSALYTRIAVHLWRVNGPTLNQLPLESIRCKPMTGSTKLSTQLDRKNIMEQSKRTGVINVLKCERGTKSGREQILACLYPSREAVIVEVTEKRTNKKSFRNTGRKSLQETCLNGTNNTATRDSVSGLSTSSCHSMKRNGESVLNTNEAVQQQRLRTRQAVLRMVIAIVVTFTICNLPFHLRKIYFHCNRDSDVLFSNFNLLLTPVTFLLMYANSAINPVICVFMSSDFRTSALDLCRCETGRTHGGRASRNRSSPV